MQITAINRPNANEFVFQLGQDGNLALRFGANGHVTSQWTSNDKLSIRCDSNAEWAENELTILAPMVPAQAGMACEYFWQRKINDERQRAKDAFLERQARRDRIAKRNAKLKGGLGVVKKG